MKDDAYVPAIARIHWSWVWILSALTGIFPLLLAIYLAWWVRKRRGLGFAFPLYLLVTVAMMVAAIPGFSPHNATLVDLVMTGLFVGWILAGFVLRSELRSFYGKELQVNVVLTAFFSVLYLDYCLWAIGDGT